MKNILNECNAYGAIGRVNYQQESYALTNVLTEFENCFDPPPL